jgi:hypothetical protein
MRSALELFDEKHRGLSLSPQDQALRAKIVADYNAASDEWKALKDRYDLLRFW